MCGRGPNAEYRSAGNTPHVWSPEAARWSKSASRRGRWSSNSQTSIEGSPTPLHRITRVLRAEVTAHHGGGYSQIRRRNSFPFLPLFDGCSAIKSRPDVVRGRWADSTVTSYVKRLLLQVLWEEARRLKAVSEKPAGCGKEPPVLPLAHGPNCLLCSHPGPVEFIVLYILTRSTSSGCWSGRAARGFSSARNRAIHSCGPNPCSHLPCGVDMHTSPG